jgi:hypothetical protein
MSDIDKIDKFPIGVILDKYRVRRECECGCGTVFTERQRIALLCSYTADVLRASGIPDGVDMLDGMRALCGALEIARCEIVAIPMEAIDE